MSRQGTGIRRSAGLALLAVLLVSIAGLLPTLTAAAPPPHQASPLRLMSSEFEALTSRVSPAVVEVLVNGYGPDDDENTRADAPIGPQSSEGSGVIVDPDGYIITNYHVIAGEQEVKVVITPHHGDASQASAVLRQRPHILPAKVVGYSKLADLAVLKVDATGLPTIPFANYRQLRQGQIVLAIGSPEGLQNSVSLGLVSSVLRQDDPESPMVYIQTDAAINPGNSGGALVDVDGNLVGINSSILTQSGGNEGIGFAIPSGIVEFVYHQIRQYGHVRNGYIGITVQAVTPELAAALSLPQASVSGVIVSDVMPESPAATAGLQVYDRILSIDSAPVDSVPGFVMNIYLRKTGDRVRLGILRGEQHLSVVVPVEEVQPHATSLADLVNPAADAVTQLGIAGIDLTTASAAFLPSPRIDSGVVAAAVLTGGRAGQIGLQEDDIIHALNAQPITSLAGLRSVLDTLKPGDAAVLQVERHQRLMFVTFEVE